MSHPKIAIVYDRVNKFGGAEQVLLALHRAFPDAPLYTSVYDRDGASWVGDWEVRTSFLQALPFARTHHEWFGWLMPLVFESLDLRAFDVVISVTSEAAKGVITRADQLHICYCLTPTRYLWSHTQEYGRGILGGVKKLLFARLREWDYIAGQRPDKIIAISARVQARIEKYYRRKADAIIYPPATLPDALHAGPSVPVSTDKKTPHSSPPLVSVQVQEDTTREYFLVVSRLVPYKMIDVAIRACVQANKPLVIVGTGSDEKRLRRIAGDSSLIRFEGFLSDSEIAWHYQHAKALLCPQEEDFGIVSCEAASHGLPVVTFAHSGMRETILQGVSGLAIATQEVSDWVDALDRVETMTWNRDRIREQAGRFSVKRFCDQWVDLVESA